MAARISVVVSQGQSNHPSKRGLEEDIVAALLMEPGIDATVIPNLYDLKPDGTGVLALQGISGHMVVLAWMYERATRWILDRNDVRGQEGVALLKLSDDDDDEDEDLLEDEADEESKERVIDQRELPNRKIYCLDLRAAESAQAFIDEIKRISAEANTQVLGLTDWIGGTPQPAQLQRFMQPTNTTALGGNGKPAAADESTHRHAPEGNGSTNGNGAAAAGQAIRIEETGGRRWYPVIDFSRCTNCMECIDFCLFGVYGVDSVDTILVEQPDNCRKGCPACSRVCPENAIIFPQHKTPAIAGSPDVSGGLKIDLSQLFGAPETDESAVEAAVRERDEQLVAAGRDAVGMEVGLPKRQVEVEAGPQDELDDLIDELDDLDL